MVHYRTFCATKEKEWGKDLNGGRGGKEIDVSMEEELVLTDM